MAKPEHKVIPKSKKKAKFKCGHTSWAKFGHEVFGQERQVRDEFFESRELCGECMLAKATAGATQCARCNAPIFKGEDCVLYPEGVSCLSVECGPGPVAYDPGVWDGKKFVHGLEAGTMRVIDMEIPAIVIDDDGKPVGVSGVFSCDVSGPPSPEAREAINKILKKKR